MYSPQVLMGGAIGRAEPLASDAQQRDIGVAVLA